MSLSQAKAIIGTVLDLILGVKPNPQSIYGRDFSLQNEGLCTENISLIGLIWHTTISLRAPKATIELASQ